MKLSFEIKGENYSEEITIQKHDNRHFDIRAGQRLEQDGEEILQNLLELMDTQTFYDAWMNSDIRPNQEIMIIDHLLGIAVPIVPDYSVGTTFTVKTVGDIRQKMFSIHDNAYVFEWEDMQNIKQYTYKKSEPKANKVRRAAPRTRVCVYA